MASFVYHTQSSVTILARCVLDFLIWVHLHVYVQDVNLCHLPCPGTCRRWPRQPGCLRWSSTTRRCHPRCPPSRSPHPTQATPSPCPLPLPPTTEMTTSRCYDAQMYVEKIAHIVHDCHIAKWWQHGFVFYILFRCSSVLQCFDFATFVTGSAIFLFWRSKEWVTDISCNFF